VCYNKAIRGSESMEKAIAAISTNNIGSGAINIIRVSGENAIDIVSKIFSNKKFFSAPTHTIHYGYIIDNDKKIDEVLVMLMRAPKTYTQEDVVEINCHGGYVTTNKILELLLLNGASLAEPGEFTKRAFLNGRINLIEAESISDILEAKTEMQATMAMNGITGTTSKLIESLREKMVSLLANIEVNIDYPEYTDELIITKENITPVLTEIKEALEKIIEESKNGQIIKNGIKIAIIGKPNVGKSSLLNALLEEEKAIVTDKEGTTRDIVEGSISYKGVLFSFIDTAGIRKTTDVVEQIGVEKSKKMLREGDIAILVLNNNEKLSRDELELLKEIENKKGIIFINKIDLDTNLETIKTNLPIIKGSTLNNVGIDKLKDKILEKFSLNDIANKDLTYLSNARQISLARLAKENIEHVIEDNKKDIPIDMLAIDIKSAWENLGKIIGKFYEDELVDNIFSRFCLGK